MKNINIIFLLLASNMIFSMEAERKSLASFFCVEQCVQNIDICKVIAQHCLSGKQWWYVEKDIEHKTYVSSACFHKDGKTLLTAEGGKMLFGLLCFPEINLYDAHTSQFTKKIRSAANDIHKLILNHAGTKIIEHSRHKDSGGVFEVACYDMSLNCEYHFTDEPRRLCCFDKTDTEMLWYKAYSNKQNVVGISNLETKKVVSSRDFPFSICSAQFNDDETEIVIMMGDGTLAVWNRELSQELLNCRCYAHGAGAYFNKTGDELLVHSYSSPSVHVVNRQNGEVVKELKHLSEGISFVCFNNNGSEICTVTSRDGVYIWDRKTGKTVAQLRNDDQVNWLRKVRSLEWNSTGTKIVAAINQYPCHHARIWARYDDCTLSQILLKKLLHLWLQLKMPSKKIDSPEKLLDNVVQLLLCDKNEMNITWQLFPKHMQEAIWLSMHNKIQKYGK